MNRFVMLALFASLSLAASQAHAQTINLPGSKWVGNETLPGYDKLTLIFQPGNLVTMIDAKATSQGAWKVENNQVILSFYNGDTMYVGELTGTTLKGGAANGNTTWNWQVTLMNAAKQQPFKVGQPNMAMTPQALPDFLRKQGYSPKIVTPEIGAPYCTLEISDKDWNFNVEVSVANNGVIWMVMRLEQVKDLEAAKLAQLLEANNTVAPCFFIYRAEDQRICLKLESISNFRADLAMLMRNTRESVSLWRNAVKMEIAN